MPVTFEGATARGSAPATNAGACFLEDESFLCVGIGVRIRALRRAWKEVCCATAECSWPPWSSCGDLGEVVDSARRLRTQLRPRGGDEAVEPAENGAPCRFRKKSAPLHPFQEWSSAHHWPALPTTS